MNKLLNKFFVLLLSILVLVSNPLTISAQDNPFDGEEVKVGVVGEEDALIWEFVAEKAAEEGITIEVEMLTDYNMPNVALSDGSLDINAYQHDDFRDNWNNENDENLVNIGFTNAVPLRMYSLQHDSWEDLPDGATIALNSAPSSLAYNLQILEYFGLITLEDSGELLPTPENIAENPHNFEFVELEGGQLAPALPDVDAAFIDNSFLAGTDFEPTDAILVYGDTPETLNLRRVVSIVAREEDQDNPLLARIVELYQSEDTAEMIIDVSNSGQIPAWDLVEEVQENE
ncbi:methionine-binding protein [Aerococcaceae bacterium DSM 111176]|nr:methionine-binding protein [Aerococcaceae bacterium DSM 111176]